ncbi:MAG: non-reducing end alpha-L-arabinofuranosidase family hydrolase [Bacteroidota bacterium]
MRTIIIIPSIFLVAILHSCTDNQTDVQYQRWTLTDTVFTSRPDHPMDNVAVKDPSIVNYNGRYHLFYTAKSVSDSGSGPVYSIGCGYASAPTPKGLNSAERVNMDSLAGRDVVAPQVFFYEPQKLWYLIAHTTVVEGELHTLEPIYLTNPDIEDPGGWSEAQILETGKSSDEFWIDFWVICTDETAYLFYANQKGSILRMECGLEDFPSGFADSTPEEALNVNHMEDEKPWRMFEAVHIYHVKEDGTYLALLEGAFSNPERHYDVESRTRFIFGMRADSLNGRWSRVENGVTEFLADAGNLYNEDGSKSAYTQVSHPELIRSGYNQKLEIDDYNLSLLFQSFDGTKIPDSYHYNELPWELILMKNY